MQTKHHWEQVYTTKPEHSVSWFQPHAHQSEQLVAQTGVPKLCPRPPCPHRAAAWGPRRRGLGWLTGDITQVELP
ncbi:MAG TPA: hypothetical protein VFY35_05510 [Burkholderiaceae bacterium]|nr:hypothetical protein [Burkholderiaceae bacterium]